ncbi:receptor-transporting protein 3-like [Pelodytes ibericus]
MGELLWQNIFNNEMEDVPDLWRLIEDPDLTKEKKGWLCYTQNTCGRFRCSLCTRGWTSKEVCVLFLLQLNKFTRHGTVNMRIFRQECSRCHFPDMENPDLSCENIKRTIHNLIGKIQKTFYQKANVDNEQKAILYGNSDGPHEQDHCEACKNGLCMSANDDEDENDVGAIVGSAALFGAIIAGGLAVLFSKK